MIRQRYDDVMMNNESHFDPQCRSCQAIRGELSLTNAPRILESDHWIVEHGHPTAVLGWLVLVLNRHCGAIHDLTPTELEEVAHLGRRRWRRRRRR